MHYEAKAGRANDSLDAWEIGEIKVLGILALLDGFETDWKAIVIDIKDPLAAKLNNIEDVELHLPKLLKHTKKWYRTYEIADGKPPNEFALSGEFRNKE